MFRVIREQVRKNTYLRKLVAYHLAPSGFFDWWFRRYRLSESWSRRCRDVVACADNAAIQRCENAGKIIRGKQVLHNGIKIHLGSYYGPEYTQMLRQNKGVHEPQEEKVFAEVLKHLPEGAVMIELGAFWAFYSMWFQKEIKNARNFLIEPDAFNLGQGKRNLKLNRMTGHFTQAFAGKHSIETEGIPTICIDDFQIESKIERVHILHSDIQGHEVEMLEGASRSLAEGKIDYLFISTHSDDLHYRCLEYLSNYSYRIIAEADLDNTFSEDGLIVAAAPQISEPTKVEVAKKESAGKPKMERLPN